MPEVHNAADIRRNERRRCVAWLHQRAAAMNDLHARQVLNSAAFSLGLAIKDPSRLPAPSRASEEG